MLVRLPHAFLDIGLSSSEGRSCEIDAFLDGHQRRLDATVQDIKLLPPKESFFGWDERTDTEHIACMKGMMCIIAFSFGLV